jgi:hypothetical protein
MPNFLRPSLPTPSPPTPNQPSVEPIAPLACYGNLTPAYAAPTWYAPLAQARYAETRVADRSGRYATRADRAKTQLRNTILRMASRSTTEEDDYEYFSTISNRFVLGCQCLVVRIYCDGQYFYGAARQVFGNKRRN